MDVEAEGQLATERLPVQPGELAVAGRGDDRLIPPERDRVGPAPGEEDAVASGDPCGGGKLRDQVPFDLADIAADAGVDLDAAVVELRLDRVPEFGGHPRQDRVDGPREGQRAGVDELEFQFHAQARPGAAEEAIETHMGASSQEIGMAAPGPAPGAPVLPRALRGDSLSPLSRAFARSVA